jgi:hypothetical protein
VKPNINSTKFGSITIAGQVFDHDVVIRLNGEVKKRKKNLSKAVFGTSHTISIEEANDLYEVGAKQVIIGTGQSGMVKLSNEAEEYLKQKKCQVRLLPTPEAIRAWNESTGELIGMFHITC